MNSTKVLEALLAQYSQCESYKDSGFLSWNLNGREGKIHFSTFFVRPSNFLFKWTGEGFCVRGDEYKSDSDLSTFVGMFRESAFRLDPRFQDFRGCEHWDSLPEALVNDSVYSGTVSRFIAGLLMPSTFPESRLDPTCFTLTGDCEPNSHQFRKIVEPGETVDLYVDPTMLSVRRVINRQECTYGEFDARLGIVPTMISQKLSIHSFDCHYFDSVINGSIPESVFNPELMLET